MFISSDWFQHSWLFMCFCRPNRMDSDAAVAAAVEWSFRSIFDRRCLVLLPILLVCRTTAKPLRIKNTVRGNNNNI